MTIELQPEFPHRTRKQERFPLEGSRPASGSELRTTTRPAKTAPYVELHAHSAYSFLDGASHPEELAVRAAEFGYPALALTDHDGLYGSLEFAHAAKHFGVRPITGAEGSLEIGARSTEPARAYAHVTLLCETPHGYPKPCRILTRRTEEDTS